MTNELLVLTEKDVLQLRQMREYAENNVLSKERAEFVMDNFNTADEAFPKYCRDIPAGFSVFFAIINFSDHVQFKAVNIIKIPETVAPDAGIAAAMTFV